MVYLKLAYLAEFAVAFNLAIGEFKLEEISKQLDAKFSNLDLGCDIGLAEITSSAAPDQIAAQGTDLVRADQTWLAKSITRFDYFRRSRKGLLDHATINPLRMFISRALLFATNPSRCAPNQRTILGMPYATMFCLPRGLLASWAYTKSTSWKHPPCWQSLAAWGFVVMASLLFLAFPENSFAIAFSYFSSESNITSTIPSSFFILFGIATGLFCLRPISASAAKFIGRYPPSPRGRYYSIVVVILVTFVIVLLTYCEIMELHYDAISTGRAFLFLLGFLIYASIFPFLLFAGHLVLETTVTNWTLWAEQAAKTAAKGAVSQLSTSPAD